MPGPVERGCRATALVVAVVVLTVIWVAAVWVAAMLLDGGPLSRGPKSPLWVVAMIGVPVAAILALLYRYRQRDDPPQT